MMPGRDAVDHRHIESHADLLEFPVDRTAADRTLDAIVVPTIRPWYLAAAADLAAATGATLLVLCSTPGQVKQAAGQVSGRLRGRAWVIGVPQGYEHGLLGFRTLAHPELEVERSCHADIARKRNVGILLAQLSGWRTILYLDDDIRGLTAPMLASAAGLVGRFRAVGFNISHYPDNSVVCHANRLANGKQDVFISGSALLVDVSRADTFFPAIYNEDWLFLFDALTERSVAATDSVSQLAYEPFARTRRAASEEFGDLIAEGLYQLIHEGKRVADATLSYWHDVIARRSAFIDHVADRLLHNAECTPCADGALMALTAAKRRLAEITPLACVSFVRAWRLDVGTWRHRLLGLPVLGRPEAAIRFLGLWPQRGSDK